MLSKANCKNKSRTRELASTWQLGKSRSHAVEVASISHLVRCKHHENCCKNISIKCSKKQTKIFCSHCAACWCLCVCECMCECCVNNCYECSLKFRILLSDCGAGAETRFRVDLNYKYKRKI